MADLKQVLTDEFLSLFVHGICLVTCKKCSHIGKISGLRLDGFGTKGEVKVLAEFSSLKRKIGRESCDLGKADFRFTVGEILHADKLYLHFTGEGEEVGVMAQNGHREQTGKKS